MPVLAGLLAPIVFSLGVVVAGLTWPGYRHRTQNVSDLGGTEAPFAIVQNANFVLTGLLVVAFASRLVRSDIGRRTAASPWLVGFFGATMAIQGATPCTPGCAQGTVADVVHGLAALSGFGSMVVATLLVWRAMRSEAGWATFARFSAWTGIVTLAFVVAWLATTAIDPGMLAAGVHQRLFIATVLVWLGSTALRLLSSSQETSVADGDRVCG